MVNRVKSFTKILILILKYYYYCFIAFFKLTVKLIIETENISVKP